MNKKGMLSQGNRAMPQRGGEGNGKEGAGGERGKGREGKGSYRYFFPTSSPGTLGGFSTENYSLPVLDVHSTIASDAGRSTEYLRARVSYPRFSSFREKRV